MTTSANRPSYVFGISLLIALAIHGSTALLVKLDWHERKTQIRTIPVVLIKNAPKRIASTPSASDNTSGKQANMNTITSTGNSEYHQTYNKNRAKDAGKATTGSDRAQNENTPSSPSIALPQSTQQFRAQTASEGLRSMFETKQENKASINQISTRKAPTLSPYQIELLNTLSNRKALYDRYHRIMDLEGKSTFEYEIELALFANGAIKNARIIRASGIPKIDELAIEAAYNASPFPKPPAQDIQTGFRYRIPIAYQKPSS